MAIFLTTAGPSSSFASLFSSKNLCAQTYGVKKPEGIYARLRKALAKIQLYKQQDHPESSYYRQAKRFAESHGFEFARFVENQVPSTGKTVITIIMGGSEHLGTLLREYKKLGYLKNVDIKEVWLNRSITGAWKVERKTQIGSRQGESRKIYGSIFREYTQIPIYKYEYLVGALDLAIPKLQSKDYVIEKNQSKNTVEELIDYTQSTGIWNYENVLIIDTGFLGAMPNVVAQLAEKVGFKGLLKGVMYTFNQENVINLKLPVVGYANGNERSEKSLWAYSLDIGQDIEQVIQKNLPVAGTLESSNIYFAQNIINSFQRSREKVTQLIQNKAGVWQTDKQISTDPLIQENWQHTVQGIQDGLQERVPRFWKIRR